MTTYHTSVLLKESIDALNIKEDGIYADMTFGGGGHSTEILKRLGKKGILISFDQDKDAQQNIPNDKRIIFAASNFKFLRGVLRDYGFEKIDGIIADLGVSSHHFDATQRGFSFRFDAPLDMRMNQNASFSAMNVINEYEHEPLLKILRDYGELTSPHKIAAEIERNRPINTTFDLVRAVEPYTPKFEEHKFLSKLFQAVRIEVNGELEALKMMLEQSELVLNSGGRLSVITYHSLEDRLVKNFIKSGNFEGKNETDFFGNKKTNFRSIGKLISPSEKEIKDNSRARSAKLRVAEKL